MVGLGPVSQVGANGTTAAGFGVAKRGYPKLLKPVAESMDDDHHNIKYDAAAAVIDPSKLRRQAKPSTEPSP